jgi:hypothetical protein
MTGPLIALGVAVLGLVVVGVGALAARSPSREVPERLLRDDLPAFHARPPGSPGAPALPSGGPPVLLAVPPPAAERPRIPAGRSSTGRPLLVLAAVVLLVLGAAAGVGLATRDAAGGQPAGRPAVLRLPALPAVPDSPPAGRTGAGRLAFTSLPLGPGDVAARLSFDGVVLERQAVGVTVTYPSVSVTTHGTLALAHVRLPTFNCLTADAPADPLAAGCVPSVTEYADLPAPALHVSHDGTHLSMQGRFPTYVRPNGTAPHYTGHVYALTVGARAGDRLRQGVFAADGVLTLGGQTARSSGRAPLDVLRRGD